MKGLVQRNVDNCQISAVGYKGHSQYVIEHFDLFNGDVTALRALLSDHLKQPGSSMLVNVYLSRGGNITTAINLRWKGETVNFATLAANSAPNTAMVSYAPNGNARPNERNPLLVPYEGAGRILEPVIVTAGAAEAGRISVVMEYINI